METTTYRWAILGSGGIANDLARAMEKQGRTIYSVANRTYEKAENFAQKHHISKVYEKIGDLFTDEDVDIIYIATPHNSHSAYINEALKNGKHVLCEKAITLNSTELEQAMGLAKERGLVLAEAMTIYHMPLYRKLSEYIASGVLGKLRLVQVNFGICKEYDETDRFFGRHLAGGALLDIGVYALSFLRWFFSSNPQEIVTQVKMAQSGVDDQSGILLMNSQGETGTVTLSLQARQPKRGMAAFEKGYIEVYEFNRGDKATVTFTEDGRQEIIEAGCEAEALWYEIQDMERAVSGAGNEMYSDYTVDVMDMMTRIRRQWGMKYPEEE